MVRVTESRGRLAGGTDGLQEKQTPFVELCRRKSQSGQRKAWRVSGGRSRGGGVFFLRPLAGQAPGPPRPPRPPRPFPPPWGPLPGEAQAPPILSTPTGASPPPAPGPWSTTRLLPRALPREHHRVRQLWPPARAPGKTAGPLAFGGKPLTAGAPGVSRRRGRVCPGGVFLLRVPN